MTMADDNRTINVNGETATFGIIGNPVHHSLSPEMHNAAFHALGLNNIYVPLPTTNLRDGIAGIRALGFRGASVTIPYKEDILPLVDHVDPVAARIGAVNTLVIKQQADGRSPAISGYNTDWIGANRALAEKLELKGSRVLIIGAGGAARAIGFGLKEAGAEVMVTNRTVAKGERLAGRLDCRFYRPEELGRLKADALINATSVGMTPKPENTPVPKEFLHNFAAVMDIVYAPVATRLLREAAASGCRVVDGLAMLLYQGAAQFELWTGRPAPIGVMRDILAKRLKTIQ